MIKQTLGKKVPPDIQQMSDYKVLLSIIKKEKIETADELKTYVDAQIKKNREWINKNQKQSSSGTMRRWLVKSTKQLDFFKLIKQKVLKYL